MATPLIEKFNRVLHKYCIFLSESRVELSAYRKSITILINIPSTLVTSTETTRRTLMFPFLINNFFPRP